MTTSQKSFNRVAAMMACAAIAVGALSACNTVEGAGKDVKSTGNAIEHTAKDNK